ncbi:MAG: hypothetical protein WCO07_01270 [bacterium]
MKKLELEVIHKAIGIFLIVLGLISYVFPIPGSTLLVVLGLVWLIGKYRAISFLRKILGIKIFKLLRIKKIIKDL